MVRALLGVAGRFVGAVIFAAFVAGAVYVLATGLMSDLLGRLADF